MAESCHNYLGISWILQCPGMSRYKVDRTGEKPLPMDRHSICHFNGFIHDSTNSSQGGGVWGWGNMVQEYQDWAISYQDDCIVSNAFLSTAWTLHYADWRALLGVLRNVVEGLVTANFFTYRITEQSDRYNHRACITGRVPPYGKSSSPPGHSPSLVAWLTPSTDCVCLLRTLLGLYHCTIWRYIQSSFVAVQ